METLTKNTTAEERHSVATEILNQLGGASRLSAMTGAKAFGAGEDAKGNIYVSFRVGRNAHSINHVKITLNGLDLYDTKYSRVSVRSVTVKSSSENIYCDGLKEDFEEATGMYLTF